MCALRRHTHPTALATSYRFEMDPRRNTPPVTVTKKEKKSYPVNIPKVEGLDANSPVHGPCYKTRTDSIADEFDEEYDFDDEDDVVPVNKLKPCSGMWLTTYLKVCKKLKRTPIKHLKNGPIENAISVKFLKVELSDLIPICVAVRYSDEVKVMEFEDNNLGSDGGKCIGEVLDDNGFINRLRIVNNNLTTEGIKAITRATVAAANLTSIDLSENAITEKDVIYIKEMIDDTSIQELYLSKNNIHSEGAQILANVLTSRYCTLRVLDLSWNHIRLDGAQAIGKALEKNTSLEKLNLAWNGLHKEGAVAIGIALRKNSTLKELDLTCNRLSEECISYVLKGLESNNTLETLHMGQNHLTCKGSIKVLESIKNSPSSGIKTIDLGTQEVTTEFMRLYDEIREDQEELTVIHGVVHASERRSLATYDTCFDEKLLLRCKPLTVLMECMRLQNYRVLDLFNRFDTNNNKMIDINELCDGMLNFGVPLKQSTMLKLLKQLDKDNNQMLDYGEIVEAHGLHQKLVRQYLQDGSAFEETEIGRVSVLLRKIMNQDLVMKKQMEARKDK